MKLKKMIDKTLALYLLVGVLNFIVCTGIMFLLYNVADVSKHFAPIVNIRGNCEMSVGSLSYALLNYFGQRYFVFSDRFAARKDRNTEE